MHSYSLGNTALCAVLTRSWTKTELPYSCPVLFSRKPLTTQLWSDTEMKSWGGVSLDPGSGGRWLKNRALGRRMCSGGITHTPQKTEGHNEKSQSFHFPLHLLAAERAQCVPLGLILSHQPPQKPPDPIAEMGQDHETGSQGTDRINSPFFQDLTHTHTGNCTSIFVRTFLVIM